MNIKFNIKSDIKDNDTKKTIDLNQRNFPIEVKMTNDKGHEEERMIFAKEKKGRMILLVV